MNLPTEIEKDILYAKKHLAWIRQHAPGTNTGAIDETLLKFEKFLPHMKVAYRLVEAAKEVPKYSTLTPQFLFENQPALYQLIEKYMKRLKSTPDGLANTFLKLKQIEFKKAELLELDQKATLNGILEIYMESGTLRSNASRCIAGILGKDKVDVYYSLAKTHKALSKETDIDNLEELIDQHLSDITELFEQEVINPEDDNETNDLVELNAFKGAKLVQLSGFSSSNDLSCHVDMSDNSGDKNTL